MSLCKTCFSSTRAWTDYGIVFCEVTQTTVTGEVVRCDHYRPRGRVTLATKFPKVRRARPSGVEIDEEEAR